MATIPQIRNRLLQGFPEPQAELNELTGVVKELAEWAVADLAKQVGGLSNVLGGSLKDFACDLTPEILENRQK